MIRLNCPTIIIPAICEEMKPTEFKLFSEMWSQWYRYKDEDDWYYISLKNLRLTSGFSVNTILPIIERWLEKGIILKKCATHRDGSSNGYKFDLQRILELSMSIIEKNEDKSLI